ncbi:coiled-coil domain-containing protein 57-like [Cyprinus carpio]|uniref:Coiled-coil domain-containing protein 57-like n=1 Tax=Cyprinus carpio TaxID=7962 RepID=A0A9Q9WY72_CYPCA|nr:coiled-coil domain-containing protein 57-like [Cyprinus carpio]XP_042591763.1 coiled-coil domain-containing protein 57-like [Cyprinus carpio]XP_042591764.1 coiled-coil domain-containing protein 57-like [Cyprinus carpio]XP_042591765.1 coiled-coil domain-containing protein 57-like [Cyprinus carpio]XP_042591766.1 coiled-coil domain-containing protein 57-like [Cyprinus carpio]
MQEAVDLEAQLACKEREWKELQALRIQQLETALNEATSELSTQRERFLRLRDDFKYNLRVLEERDKELERYDALAARAQTEESARREEVSELRIEIAKLQDALEEQRRAKEDIEVQYQKKGVEHRVKLEKVQNMMESEIQKLREENETLRRDLQRRIRESDGELALQKQEMMADFDSEMRKREHEFHLKLDEMNSVVLSHELKEKLLSKELEVHAKAHSQATEALQASEELHQQAQKEIQRRDWEIKNTTAMKDSRIKELEDIRKQMENNYKKEQEAYNRKHSELERRSREKEDALGLMREAHARELQEERGKISELQAQLDRMILEQKRREKSHKAALHHREQQIEEIRTQLETTRSGWDTYITQVSKENVAKDTELLSAGEREAKVRAELERCKEDIERYKQQVSSGLQREQALEQKRVQLELDWERRCEEVRSEHYLRSEELIQSLTQARDQITAELREKERELQETVTLLKSVTVERDQALRGIKPTLTGIQASAVDSSSFPSEEIRRLQQQNCTLRTVVAEMRKDMENLSQQMPIARSQTTNPEPNTAGTTDYSQALEKEIQELKAKCRDLEERLEESSKIVNTASIPALAFPVSPDNAYLQNHIRSLNETIGGLRVEKVANAAALKKQEVRLAHLESAVEQLTQQCHSKHIENESLRLELANHKRAAAAEEARLKQRVAATELELNEVRREAEEYQKGSLLYNLETVALGNQVSALKVDLASRREPIVLNQSEMVKQLQEENLSMRQQLLLLQSSARGGTVGDVATLQSKLKQAARLISSLSQDKRQLIEMGNRLRAQLIEAGLEVPRHSKITLKPNAPEHSLVEKEPSQSEHGVQPKSRLSTLEQLQYQLTTQELQYAQRDQNKKMAIIVRPQFSESDSSGKRRTANPWEPPIEVQSVGSKENTPPQNQSEAPVRLPGSSHFLLSSIGTDDSLQNVWKMLDQGLSSSVFSTSDSEDKGRVATANSGPPDINQPPAAPVSVEGTKASLQEKKKQNQTTFASAKKTHPAGKKSKIRNYNIKD